MVARSLRERIAARPASAHRRQPIRVTSRIDGLEVRRTAQINPPSLDGGIRTIASYTTWTGIRRGWTRSTLGKWSTSTPRWNSAEIPLASIDSPIVNAR
jgi:hypothetical protein